VVVVVAGIEEKDRDFIRRAGICCMVLRNILFSLHFLIFFFFPLYIDRHLLI
jgi:hypothetical protein